MKIVPIVMLAAIVATPAFAGSMKKKRMHHTQGYVMQEPNWRGSRAQYRGGEYLRGPNVRSPSGRFIGRDPSPAVRQQMYDFDQKIRGPL
jgi:hypothetical protein